MLALLASPPETCTSLCIVPSHGPQSSITLLFTFKSMLSVELRSYP